MAVDGQGPRIDVSLPIRYTRDGRAWGDGVVTSLSTTNLFVQSTALPDLQSRVFLSLGLGGGVTYHGEAKVTAYLNRDIGGMTASGFGLKFEEAPVELVQAIAKFERAYPGALGIDIDGQLIWPVPVDPDLPTPGGDNASLLAWSGERWLEVANPGASAPFDPNRSLPEYLSELRALAPQISAMQLTSVVLAYRGRPLAPVAGLPRSVLQSGLEALERAAHALLHPEEFAAAETSEPQAEAADSWTLDLTDLDDLGSPAPATGDVASAPPASPLASTSLPPHTDIEVLAENPLLELVAIQMRIVDSLRSAAWRFQRIQASQANSLERDRAVLEGVSLRLGETPEEIGPDPSLAREIQHAIEDLSAFIERTGWHSLAMESAEDNQEAYGGWQADRDRQARQAAAQSARGGQREPDKADRGGSKKGGPAKKEKEDPRKIKEKSDGSARVEEGSGLSRTIHVKDLAVGAVVCVIVLGLGWAVVRWQQRTPPLGNNNIPQLLAEAGVAAPAIAIVKIDVNPRKIQIVVSTDWLSRTPHQRQGDLEGLGLAVLAWPVNEVTVATTDGGLHATYLNGQLQGGSRDTAVDDARK